MASGLLFLTIVFLTGSFFRAQVLQHSQYAQPASEKNRLREVPIRAARWWIWMIVRARSSRRTFPDIRCRSSHPAKTSLLRGARTSLAARFSAE